MKNSREYIMCKMTKITKDKVKFKHKEELASRSLYRFLKVRSICLEVYRRYPNILFTQVIKDKDKKTLHLCLS